MYRPTLALIFAAASLSSFAAENHKFTLKLSNAVSVEAAYLPVAARKKLDQDIKTSLKFFNYHFNMKSSVDVLEVESVTNWAKTVGKLVEFSADDWSSRWAYSTEIGEPAASPHLWTYSMDTKDGPITLYSCSNISLVEIKISRGLTQLSFEVGLLGGSSDYFYAWTGPKKHKTQLTLNAAGKIIEIKSEPTIIPTNYRNHFGSLSTQLEKDAKKLLDKQAEACALPN